MINGESLFDVLLSNKHTLNEHIIATLFNKCVRALSYLHGAGIVQKDVRPHNFIVIKESNWDIKLMDFGSVNTKSELGDNNNKNNLSHSLNVNFYMAPECYDGTFLPESDVWSCGIIL